MEIFNDILKINNNEVMIVYDVNGNIWFKFKDILLVIGYLGTIKHQKNIKINQLNIRYVYNNQFYLLFIISIFNLNYIIN
jgi:hypothetical protein